MMPQWSSDIEISLPIIEQVIFAQFPNFQGECIKKVNEGWDNVIFEVAEKWYFRFPRRQVALKALQTEISHLPKLAPFISLPIPTPKYIGKPSSEFPHPFYGFLPIEGREACDFDLSEGQRNSIAIPLARFLKRLHSEDVYQNLKEGLEADPIGRLDFSKRHALGIEKLEKLKIIGESLNYQKLTQALDEACLAKPTRLSIVHGDLYFRHILCSPEVQLAGVIDWGDLQVNDPAVDFQMFWSFFPKEGRRLFETEYEITSNQKALAKGVAVFLNAILLEYGIAENLKNVEREARKALHFTVNE